MSSPCRSSRYREASSHPEASSAAAGDRWQRCSRGRDTTTVTTFDRTGMLRQHANRKLCPVNKFGRESMRSRIQLPEELKLPCLRADTDKAISLPKSSAAIGRAAVEQPLITADLYRQLQPLQGRFSLQAACPREAGSNATSPPPDPRRNAVRAAMSWVRELLIEGFAACGAAMSPGWFQPHGADLVDRGGPDEAARWRHPADQANQRETCPDEWLARSGYHAWSDEILSQRHRDRAIPAAAVDLEAGGESEAPQPPASRWTALIPSPLARVLSKRRTARPLRLTSRVLEALDDRILEDIGIPAMKSKNWAERGSHTR